MKLFAAILASFILFSCAPTSQYQSSDEGPKKDIKHIYQIYAWDVNSKGIPNARVEVSRKVFGISLKDTVAYTNDSGWVKISVPTDYELWTTKSRTSYKDLLVGYHYNSEISFKVSKEGYYSNFGNEKQQSSFALLDKSYNALPYKYAPLKLLKPTDYFADEFFNTNVYSSMKEKVLSFIDILLIQSILQNVQLQPKSINTSLFKENNYLSITLKSVNVYNSLKLTKYDIGKKLFDEIVRKILNPLNDNLSLVDELYGYDLVINGYTKSFADEGASNTKIEYRFYIPKDIVAKYKNKDISGQQLLDNSIILMDDERVEFKLQ